MKLTSVIIGIVLLILGFAGGWWVSSRGVGVTPFNAVPPPTQPVLTQTRVIAQGRILPKSGLINVFAPPNQRIESILVREGEFVTAGTQLATFAGQSALGLQTDLAQSQAEDARRELEQRILAAEGNLLAAENNVDRTQLQLQQLQDEEAILVAEKQLQSARDRWQRMARLAEDPATRWYVAQANLDEQQLAIDQAQSQLNTARQQRASARQAAQLSLEAAKQARQQAQTVLNSLRQLQEENRTVELSQTIAETNVESARLVAPSNATVLKINGRPGEVMVQNPLMQLGDLAHIICVAEVVDRMVPDLQPNQAATITSPALGRPIRGTVTSIGRVVGSGLLVDPNPLAATDRRTVEVTITIDSEDLAIARSLINLQVNVEIIVQSFNTGTASPPPQAEIQDATESLSEPTTQGQE
jgi:HlyD family secretion protein